MKVARLEITRFRGFSSLVLTPRLNSVVVGEPRSGRSDLIAALRRVLEPRSVRLRPSDWDIHRTLPGRTSDQGEGRGTEEAEDTTVEVSLLDLPDETEQLLQEQLELFAPSTGLITGENDSNEAELGVRIRYVLRDNPEQDTLDHWLEYPKSGIRVPRREHELVQAVVLDQNPPLELRAEGSLRHLARDAAPESLNATLERFSGDIAAATQTLANSDEVQAALELVATHGARTLLDLDPRDLTANIGFTAEDGSLAALLRAVQPTLDLDAAGPLPLSSHGSTTTAVLRAAEGIAAAQSDEAIVVADDFGDHLDAASSEYLAARLRRRVGQLWLTTRRPEVTRAFEPEELLRLTREGGTRPTHQLAEHTDRKEKVRRRHLSTLLSSAVSAESVALLEGPHDMESYTALSWRQFAEDVGPPLAAYGMTLVPASRTGGEGGKHELPKIAQLASDLGLRVRVVLDNDRQGANAELIEELRPTSELIVHLPEGVAVDRALVYGINPRALRSVLQRLNEDHELNLEVESADDSELPAKCTWALKQKGGLHRQYIDELPHGVHPPIASQVLKHLAGAAPADPLITLDSP